MLENLKSILFHECRLAPQSLIVVGVSGGPDSLCLLDVLHHMDFPLVAAHLNHGLRQEAAQDALAVEKIANQMGIRFNANVVDTREFAARERLSIEEAARELRYAYLFNVARQFKAQAVAVGHTADDQVETVLMHLLRGAGLDGLKGMPFYSLPTTWSQDIPLLRPLLSTWREQVMSYCQERDLHPVLDHTNLDTAYYRNRLRHELIPTLESYNPRVRKVLLRTAQVLTGDDELLQHFTQVAWQDCLLLQGQGNLAFDLPRMRRLLPGLQRRILRQGIACHRPGLRDVDFQTIERGRAFLEDCSQGEQCDLSAGVRLLREGNQLWLATWEADLSSAGWPAVATAEEYPLELPGSIALKDGWQLSLEFGSDPQGAYLQAIEQADPYQAWLDAATVAFPLAVRARRPGDRMQPLGMAGHSIKISDLMVNLKLPRRARRTWPLVFSGSRLIWLPGFRLSEQVKITPHTRRSVRLCLERTSPVQAGNSQ